MKNSLLIILLGLILGFTKSNSVTADNLYQVPDEKKYGEDSVACLSNLSLYREFYKQWKNSKYKSNSVKDAIKPWRYVFLNCPQASKNIYLDGVKIIGYRIKAEKDPAVKEKLIDTLELVYDTRIKYFGTYKGKKETGSILARKGVDLMKYAPKRYETAFNSFKESIELDGSNAYAPGVVYYMSAADKMAKAGKIDKAVVIDVYDQTSTIMSGIIKKYEAKGDTKRVASYKSYLGNIEKFFTPYANCEDLIAIYKDKFAANPEDVDLLKKITNILKKKKCEESELFFQASEKLYSLEPSPEAALNLAIMLYKDKKYSDAIKYLKEAEAIEDTDDLQKVYLVEADCFRSLGQYSSGRDAARKLLKLNPKAGNAYVLIAQMYASSGKQCGSNELEKKAVFWAAVDQLYKAKSVDPEIAATANKLINTYSQYFPSSDKVFFYNYTEGQEYKIDCWMNVTTKVRARK
ncbi:MAG: tetratricopeptide repeat protein [Hyphomicrobiales bacterium]